MKSLILVLTMITTAAHAVPEHKDSFICPYKDPSTMIKEPVNDRWGDYLKFANVEHVLKTRTVKAADVNSDK